MPAGEPGREQFDLVRGIVPARGARVSGLRSTQIVPRPVSRRVCASAAAGSKPAPEFTRPPPTPTPVAHRVRRPVICPPPHPCRHRNPSPRRLHHTRKPLRRMRPAADTLVHTRRGHRQTSAAQLSRGHRALGHQSRSPGSSGGTRAVVTGRSGCTPNRCRGCTGCRRTRQRTGGRLNRGRWNRGHRTVGRQAHATETCSPTGPGRAAPTRFDEAYIAQPGRLSRGYNGPVRLPAVSTQ